METLNFKSNYYILKETGNNIKWHFPFRRLRACKEITCSMNFKKQRPDPPFFFEKEQVISLLRLRACKEITCSMNFKKQRPNPPFFFEKEQVISLLRPIARGE